MMSLSKEQIQKIDMMINSGNKVEAIKQLIEYTGWGLLEAKTYVDNFNAAEEMNKAISMPGEKFIKTVEADIENSIMKIEGSFKIVGKGTVVTGILNAPISVGKFVVINNKQYEIQGIESNKQIIYSANAGMAVGLLLKGSTDTFQNGDSVISVAKAETASKQNHCNSCGGELEKDGNVYVCKQCGEVFKNEYAAEHGNIEVHKKVKKTAVNFSEEKTERLNNLYTIARRAKDNDDAGQAEKYYDMILAEDPNSWEAVFYTTFFNVSQCKIGEIAMAADKLENSLNSVFDLIDEYAQDETTAITDVYTKTKSFADLLYSNAQSHYARFKDTSNSISEFLTRCNSIYLLLCELGDQLEKRYILNPAIGNMCANVWKRGIEIRLNYRFWDEASKQKILSYSDKVKKYDPSYQGVNFNSGGCYVATCVYGSYNCPQVWTLRRYRDNTLAKTWHGRAFIHTYYAISPTIVKWFGNTTWFKKLWRGKLDKMVRNLNNDGVSNAPYEDRSW